MENNMEKKLLILSDSHGRTGKLKNIIMDNSDTVADGEYGVINIDGGRMTFEHKSL